MVWQFGAIKRQRNFTAFHSHFASTSLPFRIKSVYSPSFFIVLEELMNLICVWLTPNHKKVYLAANHEKVYFQQHQLAHHLKGEIITFLILSS